MLMSMRFDSDSADGDTPSAAAAAARSGMALGAGLDAESVVHALVDAKVALAEREFEVMDLQGRVRAREAHIEALSEHLSAIRAAAVAERNALASPVSVSLRSSIRSMGFKALTPQSATPPAPGAGGSPGGESDAIPAAVGKRPQSPAAVHIFAHAGVPELSS